MLSEENTAVMNSVAVTPNRRRAVCMLISVSAIAPAASRMASGNEAEVSSINFLIRKHDVAALLAPDNRSPLPLELELEVAKMIFRNFEVHPPLQATPQSQLASNLMRMAQAYLNPRLLLRDKYSACASLAIEAIVAMRSDLAAEAWDSAMRSPHRWFGEIVNADLAELGSRWSSRNAEAADWLAMFRLSVFSRCQDTRSGRDAGHASQ